MKCSMKDAVGLSAVNSVMPLGRTPVSLARFGTNRIATERHSVSPDTVSSMIERQFTLAFLNDHAVSSHAGRQGIGRPVPPNKSGEHHHN